MESLRKSKITISKIRLIVLLSVVVSMIFSYLICRIFFYEKLLSVLPNFKVLNMERGWPEDLY